MRSPSGWWVRGDGRERTSDSVFTPRALRDPVALPQAFQLVSAPRRIHFAAMEAGDRDEALMLRYRDGDAHAFEVLYARHRTALFRFLRRQCTSAAVAEELYQEAWIRVIDARSRYEPRARFTTWLYTIAHNLLTDHYRRSGRRPLETSLDDDAAPVAEVHDDPQHQPLAMLDRKRLATRLVAAIESLPETQREAFLLQQEAGLSVEEIAAATGVGFETAKSRLRYALARLRESLADLTATDSG